MNIVRAPRHGQFELIPVAFLRDKSLSFRARGLGSRILTNVDGYACTALTLAAESEGEGKHAIQTALGELRHRRYLIVYHRQGYGGRWETWSVMHDMPQPASALCDCKRCLKEKEKNNRAPEPDNQVPVTETCSPDSGGPGSGPPTAGNRASKSSNTRTSTNINITTTQPGLIWPIWFDESQQVVVLKRMDGLNQVLQQQLLDEFAGKMEKSPPRVPMDWFRGTIEKARTGKDGGFVPSLGLAVAERRAKHAQEAADKVAARVAAAEAEERKSKRQALLDALGDSQVRELLAGNTEVTMSQVEDWLRSGRPAVGVVAAAARNEIGRRK